MNRSTTEKIRIFRRLFRGQEDYYGTYCAATGRVRQVKAPVNDNVVLQHLLGRQPYGIYLLVEARTKAVVVDFDSEDIMKTLQYVQRAKHYDLSSYIERSKSKGYHVWIFFDEPVLAYKARLVARHILHEIEEPNTEVFPKHNALGGNVQFGSFINAPLFGAKVPEGRTVFVDPTTFEPYEDQWSVLDSVHEHHEFDLDEIIELNDLKEEPEGHLTSPHNKDQDLPRSRSQSFSLPPCALAMLREGVKEFQRISCFRIAVHLKRLGLPFDIAVAVLESWAKKNTPLNGKRRITLEEIISQARYAFSREYVGSGCESEAVMPFCSSNCPLFRKRHDKSYKQRF